MTPLQKGIFHREDSQEEIQEFKKFLKFR